MEPTKQMFFVRIGALAAIVAIALIAYSGVVATPQKEEPPAPAAAQQYRDPSLAGLAAGPDAADGDVEIYY